MGDYFNINGSDEDCVACLHQMARGIRRPNNVLYDVDPFAFHPKNLPDDFLYLVRSNVHDFNESGYWERLDVDFSIGKDPSCVGWLNIMGFYEGRAPNAVKTNWLMQVYRLDYREQRDSILFCRVPHLNPHDEIEQFMDYIIAEEENHQNSEHASHGGQVVSGNEQLPPVGLDHAADDLPVDGNYLELNDLIGYVSSPSSGDNSSRVTLTSDDYLDDEDFNSEAFLSDQESQTGPTPPNVSRCRARPTPGSNQVVIKPPTSGGAQGDKKSNDGIKVPLASTPANETAQRPSLSASLTAKQTPGNVKNLQNAAAKAEATPSTSTALGGEKKEANKITKIGKKFFCFISC